MAERQTSILLVNDDGIDAPGIQALRAELQPHYRVTVVAPMTEKSGAGCSLSLSNEMEVATRQDGDGPIWGYAVAGTPADCVKFALTALPNYRPDLVLSGINRGYNLGNSVFYSGTVAGAIEATLFGHTAMACSLGCWGHPEHHYEDAAKVVHGLVPWILAQPKQPRTLWNLNVPNLRRREHGPIRITSHGTSFFEDVFTLYRQEGERCFYRNTGNNMVACAVKEDSDDRTVDRGEVSLTLLHLDLGTPLPPARKAAVEAELQAALKNHKG